MSDGDNVIKHTDRPWLLRMNHVRRSLGYTPWSLQAWNALGENNQWSKPIIGLMTRDKPWLGDQIKRAVLDAESLALSDIRDMPLNDPMIQVLKDFRDLNADIPRVLVTNGGWDWLRLSRMDEALQYFTHVVTKDEVRQRGLQMKPAIDPWVLASELCGVPLEQCVIFEDTGANLAPLAGKSCNVHLPLSEQGSHPESVLSIDTVVACEVSLSTTLVLDAYEMHQHGALDISGVPDRLVIRDVS